MNEARDKALDLARQPLEGRPLKELATLTGERFALLRLSKELGRPLERIWSSEVTEWQAFGYLERAVFDLEQAFAEAERKRKKPGRRR